MHRFVTTVVGLLLAASCASEPTVPQASDTSGLSTEPALAIAGDTETALRTLADTWSMELGDTSFAEVPICPAGDWIRLLTLTLDETDSAIIIDALAGQTFTFVATDRQQTPYSACEFNGDGDGSAGFLFEAAPQDLASYAEDFADIDNTDAVLDISEPREVLDGTLGTICGRFDQAPRTDYCSVVWFDEELLIEAFVRGEGANEIDVEPIASSFEGVLPALLEQLVAEV